MCGGIVPARGTAQHVNESYFHLLHPAATGVRISFFGRKLACAIDIPYREDSNNQMYAGSIQP
jgi:hypothetical protein